MSPARTLEMVLGMMFLAMSVREMKSTSEIRVNEAVVF
jgi:hypothetical protein